MKRNTRATPLLCHKPDRRVVGKRTLFYLATKPVFCISDNRRKKDNTFRVRKVSFIYFFTYLNFG